MIKLELVWEKDMALNITICDDNQTQLNQIEDKIYAYLNEYEPHVLSYASAEELLSVMKDRKSTGQSLPEIVMLDIELPDINGIELGKQIKQMYPEIYLVFLTAYSEYAIRGYEAKADGYLLKPLTREKLKKVINDFACEKHNEKRILIKDKETEHLICVKDILYICAEDKYTILYTENNRYFDYKSLKDYDDLLSKYGFFRIHRKYLVNMYHHKALKKGYVTLSNDKDIPISRRRKMSYREQLMNMFEQD